MKWNKQPCGCFKIDCDGSQKDNVGKWGVVYRDDEGSLVNVAHSKPPFNSTDLIELGGLEQGLKLA